MFFFLLIPLLHFVVAYGLWMNVRWAWALTLVLNILFLVYSLISLASLSPFNALLLFMYPLIFLPLLIGISSTEPLIVACAVAIVVDVAIIWYLSARALRKAQTSVVPCARILDINGFFGILSVACAVSGWMFSPLLSLAAVFIGFYALTRKNKIDSVLGIAGIVAGLVFLMYVAYYQNLD